LLLKNQNGQICNDVDILGRSEPSENREGHT
jgi:hypothetical protein